MAKPYQNWDAFGSLPFTAVITKYLSHPVIKLLT